MSAANPALERREIASELASALPPYDPLERKPQTRSRALVVLSLLLHLALLAFFWDTLLGAIIEEEEIVEVRMMEPEPEPKKLRRKVVAQRVLDTSVRRKLDITQPEIREVKPVEVLDSVRKVEVDPLKITEAPKVIEQKRVVTRTVSVFGEVVQAPKPVQIDREAKTVKQVRAARKSSGPRRIEASSPVATPEAVTVTAPRVARGVLSTNAQEGDVEGARIAALESGSADRFTQGDGKTGLISGGDKDCMKDPVCRAYLEMIRDRVYARWNAADATGGKVKLRFRVDRGGSAHGIAVVKADEELLGRTCQTAMRHASPFPPPPEEILYIVNKGIIATFTLGPASEQ